MEKKENVVIFETNLTWVDKLLTWAQILTGFLGIYFFISKFKATDWVGFIFCVVFWLVWIIQGIRGAKTFHLFTDKLVIKRPFFFNEKMNITVKTINIKTIIFRNVRGRFGGPHIIINAKGLYESYRISFSESVRNDFVAKIRSLGVNVTDENA